METKGRPSARRGFEPTTSSTLCGDSRRKVSIPQTFVAGLRPLQPRLYSISSSLSAMPDEAHITLAPVRYELHGEARHGVASAHLADRGDVGDTLPIYIQPNAQFRLPEDDKAIIMIGAGTGIAPFRAFLQEREARARAAAPGCSSASATSAATSSTRPNGRPGSRTACSAGWTSPSRATGAARSYVQHRMLERSGDLFAWLEDGAHLYLCGDAAPWHRTFTRP